MAEFRDRIDAGRQLARRLSGLRDQDVVVLGLPRGGVPVAHEVAEALDAPLDVITVRKLGVPVHPELAMGAIGEEGARVIDERIVEHFHVTQAQLDAVEEQERTALDDRVARFREGREPVELAGRTVVIVDDGIATGATAGLACRVARQLGAARVLLAVPVAPEQAVARMSAADEVVVLATPPDFQAVGQYYRDFSQTSDEEVVSLLDAAARRHQGQLPAAGARPASAGVAGEDVRIPARGATLEARLQLPAVDAGVVILADGDGGNRHVASVLRQAGLGTLVLDLLTSEEKAQSADVLDIDLLGQRLTAAAAWLHQQPHSMSSGVGYFGSGAGAGAALWAAGEPDARVEALVSLGGRADLAGTRLGHVQAPTLLVVGGQDGEVLDINRRARNELGGESRLAVVEDAGHLFEEPGTLQTTAELARDWFARYLTTA